MSPLERKKKLFEIEKVKVAKMEMELKIEERLQDIERLKEAIQIQEDHAEKLKEELAELDK